MDASMVKKTVSYRVDGREATGVVTDIRTHDDGTTTFEVRSGDGPLAYVPAEVCMQVRTAGQVPAHPAASIAKLREAHAATDDPKLRLDIEGVLHRQGASI